MPPKFSQMRLALEARGQHEFLAIPPGNDERAVRLHRDVGKICPDGIGDAGESSQIGAEKRIGIDLVLDQCRDHGGGDGYLVPILGMKGWGGKGFALGVHFARRLQRPAVAKREGGVGMAGVLRNHKARERQDRNAQQAALVHLHQEILCREVDIQRRARKRF